MKSSNYYKIASRYYWKQKAREAKRRKLETEKQLIHILKENHRLRVERNFLLDCIAKRIEGK